VGSFIEGLADGRSEGVCERAKAMVGADVTAITEGAEPMAGAVVAATEGAEDMIGAVVVAAAELVLLGLVAVSLVPNTVPRIIAKMITTMPVQTKAQRRVFEPSSSTTSACATCPISPRSSWNF
jgi:hypothetical protein